MKKSSTVTLIVVAVIVIAAIVVGLVFFFRPHPSGYAVRSGPHNFPQKAVGGLFSNTPFYQYSYQIFPGNLSSKAEQAITGFNLKIQNNSDGSTTINLIATNPEYKTQTYTVNSGDKVYFIERSLGDDSNGEDHFFADDMAVVVNSTGDIIQGPGSA